MNNKTMCFIAFSLGAAAGVVVSWRLLKKKYEQIAQEEIDSVKEVFSQRHSNLTEEVEGAPTKMTKNTEDDAEEIEYRNMVNDHGYTNYSDISRKAPVTTRKEYVMGPYVITEDEFGELDEYETNTLTYYADGVLADDVDDVIEDVEATVGHESLMNLGPQDDRLHLFDSVYVRNDEKKCDYEILFDVRRYADVFIAKTEE